MSVYPLRKVALYALFVLTLRLLMRHHHQPHCFHCLYVHFFFCPDFDHLLIQILDWWKSEIDNIENWPQLTNDERPACPTCTAASFNYSSGTCTILPPRWKIAEQLHEKFTKGETNHVHIFLNVSKNCSKLNKLPVFCPLPIH